MQQLILNVDITLAIVLRRPTVDCRKEKGKWGDLKVAQRDLDGTIVAREQQ